MSWASTIAGSISTPNQSSRNGREITGWIIHHNAATGGLGVLEMMRTGSKQVSANYQVLENGDVWGVVPRENRSWSASNSAWDGASITFEIANNSGAPGWTISDRAYDRVARTIAEDAAWAGIPINRTTVRGHREGSALGDGGSYSTACPGGINLDYLVDLANGYRSGLAGGGWTPIEEDILAGLTNEEQRELHTWMKTVVNNWFPDTQLAVLAGNRGVENIQTRLSTGAGYDWLPAIANQGNAVLAALGGMSPSGGISQDQIAELAKSIRDGLGDEVANELSKRLAP